MKLSYPVADQSSCNKTTPNPIVRSTKSAFARGRLGGVFNEVTPLVGAVPSPSSHSFGDMESLRDTLDSPSSLSTSSPTNVSTPKRGVPHVYRDYTQIPDHGGYIRRKTGGVTQPFPDKLHEMLSHVQEADTVAWLPHGRAFIVRKPKDFTTRIMPQFFRQTKLTSFQRQLNLYGFRRLTQGPDTGAYYHELFLRGRPQLSLRMHRQKVKGTGHKQPADAMTEPNFYAMPVSSYCEAQNHQESTDGTEAASTAKQEPMLQIDLETYYDDMSPGMRNLHGAANLLKNIAAGVPVSSMKGTSLTLEDSALSVPVLPKDGIRQRGATPPENLSPLAPLVPEGKPSARISIFSLARHEPMSLLGRVNMEHPSTATSKPSQSVWPPVMTPVPTGSMDTTTSTHFFQDMKQTSTAAHSQMNPYVQSATSKDDSGPMELKVSNGINEIEINEV